jgi:hypothetical protein
MAADAMYRVGSDPGEDDTYGAPTKVGPMSKAAIDKLMRDAEASNPPVSGVAPAVKKSGTVARVAAPKPAAAEPIPVLYDDEDDDGGLDPTRLTNRSQPPSAKAIAVVTEGPRAIVAKMVAEALAAESGERKVEKLADAAEIFPPDPPTQPKRPALAHVATVAFPEWIPGPPPYAAPSPPAVKEMSDRKLAAILAGSAVTFVTFAVPFLWWLFH